MAESVSWKDRGKSSNFGSSEENGKKVYITLHVRLAALGGSGGRQAEVQRQRVSTDCMLLTDLGTWALDTDTVFLGEMQEMGATCIIKR